MSAQPVDVRGWIREAAVAIDRVYGPQAQLPKEADAVSAAVAELIEKADTVATVLSNLIAAGRVDARYGAYVTDLTAALGRIGGGK